MSMIRGAHPALLIVDDAKKDTKTHNYKWTMQLATDIVIESTTNKANGMYDVVLKESTGNRKLLVRMLNQSDFVSGTVPAKIDTTWYTTGDGKSYKNYRLVCESNSVSPDFKVLLFPHLAGEALPSTSWNADKTNLNLNWTDQTANLAFSVTNGRTYVSLLPTDITLLNSENSGLEILPNPASKNIVLKNVADSTISISDLSGREKMKFLCKNNDVDINVSNLPPACYILKITKGVSERQAKLLIKN